MPIFYKAFYLITCSSVVFLNSSPLTFACEGLNCINCCEKIVSAKNNSYNFSSEVVNELSSVVLAGKLPE